MSTVTITGRIATTYLDRGETVTVERTEHVDRLIAGGYVAISGDDALVGVAYPPETVEAADEPQGAPADGPDEDDAPARSASRAQWADFLLGLGYDVSDDQTRADLIEAWDGTRR